LLQVPFSAVSVCPTVGVPLIVGGEVFTGVAAVATPAAASATSAANPRIMTRPGQLLSRFEFM
jgi:hypothetical protein